MWKEFKEFAFKSNVLDLAVAVIIGTTSGKIVSSLVNDIVMPIIGILIGGLNFTTLQIKVGTAVINYGQFLQNVADFLIISVTIFLIVKAINSFKRKQKPEPMPVLSGAELLLAEIRDLLKEKF